MPRIPRRHLPDDSIDSVELHVQKQQQRAIGGIDAKARHQKREPRHAKRKRQRAHRREPRSVVADGGEVVRFGRRQRRAQQQKRDEPPHAAYAGLRLGRVGRLLLGSEEPLKLFCRLRVCRHLGRLGLGSRDLLVRDARLARRIDRHHQPLWVSQGRLQPRHGGLPRGDCRLGLRRRYRFL